MYRGIIFIITLCCTSLNGLGQNKLEDYLNAARQNSPLARDNKNLAKVSELEAERLHAFYNKARVSITGNYLFTPIIARDNNHNRFEANPAAADQYTGYDLSATNGGLYQGLINFSQPLFNGGEAFEEQARVTAQINRNTAKLSVHDLEKLVTDQYILCLMDKNRMAFAGSMRVLLGKQLDIVRKMVENGLLKQSDLTLLKIEQQNYEGLSTSYRATYQRDLLDLNVLCGIQDTSLVMLADIDLNLSQSTTSTNFLEKYKLDSLNLLAAQEVFEAKYKPQLNLIANTGLNAVYAPTIPNRFGMSAGLSFTWNLFDGRQNAITQKKTKIGLETVSFYRENFLNQNQVRKAKALKELQSYNERLSIAENQLKEYDLLLRRYTKEILQGQLSIIDYITTLKNRNMVQRDYILLQANRQLLINMYNYWNW